MTLIREQYSPKTSLRHISQTKPVWKKSSPFSSSSSSSSLWQLGPACAPKPGWSDWPHTHRSAAKGMLSVCLSFGQWVSCSPPHLQPVQEGEKDDSMTSWTLTGPLHTPLYCAQPESGGAWGQQDELGCKSYQWNLQVGKFRALQHLGPMTLKSVA